MLLAERLEQCRSVAVGLAGGQKDRVEAAVGQASRSGRGNSFLRRRCRAGHSSAPFVSGSSNQKVAP
jgi:hypothetical protein